MFCHVSMFDDLHFRTHGYKVVASAGGPGVVPSSGRDGDYMVAMFLHDLPFGSDSATESNI